MPILIVVAAELPSAVAVTTAVAIAASSATGIAIRRRRLVCRMNPPASTGRTRATVNDRPGKRKKPRTASALPLWGSTGRVAFLEDAALDLPHRTLRNLVDEVDPARPLERRQRGRAPAEVGHLLVRQRRVTANDERRDHLTPTLVGQAGDDDVGDPGTEREHRLDLERVDVLPAADDHVVGAPDDVEITVLVAVAEVAGEVPAVPEHSCRCLVGAQIAGECVGDGRPGDVLAESARLHLSGVHGSGVGAGGDQQKLLRRRAAPDRPRLAVE